MPGAPTKTGSHAGVKAQQAKAPATPGEKRRGRPPVAKRSEKQQALHEKALRMAERRQREQSEEWREKYRVRAGIESVNRGIDRRTGVKKLRVRGERAVSHSIYGKVMGWNILHAARGLAQRERKAQKRAEKAIESIITAQRWLKTWLRQQVLSTTSALGRALEARPAC